MYCMVLWNVVVLLHEHGQHLSTNEERSPGDVHPFHYTRERCVCLGHTCGAEAIRVDCSGRHPLSTPDKDKELRVYRILLGGVEGRATAKILPDYPGRDDDTPKPA